MKTSYLLSLVIFIFLSHFSFAFSPQAIPYQAVARDNVGELIINQNISIRFSIRDDNATGTILYQETHIVTTNDFGLFSVNIGQGTVVIGTFSSVKWGSNEKFLQVELDPTSGNSFTTMGTQQMLSVPYALHAGVSENILDSLVLRDSTGDVRMVLNPNTGMFKMMNNDTVWYSVEVNSPPTIKQNLEGGYTFEKGSNNGSSYEIIRNPAGGIVNSKIISIQPNGDVTTITRENADDGTPLKITNETYTKETIGMSTYTVKHTTIEEYKGGVLVKKSFSNGYRTTTEYFDETTGQLIYREEKEPQNAYGDLFIVTVYDSTGTITSRRQENATGQITGYFNVATQKSTTVEPGKITAESPTAKNEVNENTITITVDTTMFRQGIDPVTQDPYLQRSDTIGNEKTKLEFKYEEITAIAPKVTVESDSSSIIFDISRRGSHMTLPRYFGGTPLIEKEANLFWDNDDDFFNLDIPESIVPLGFRIDASNRIFYTSSESFYWTQNYLLPLSSCMRFDYDGFKPRYALDWYENSVYRGLYSVYPLSLNGEFICSAYDPVSTNTASIHFVPSQSYIEFNSELRCTSPINFGNGGSIYYGPSSVFVGPSGVSLTSSSSVFNVTPTLSSWVGTLSLSSANLSNIISLDNSSIYLSSGSSLFTVTPSLSTFAGTLSLTSQNGSNILLVENSGINLSSGSSIFSVTPSLSTWTGTLSCSSFNGSNNIYLQNSGIYLSSGLNNLSFTPSFMSYTGTLTLTSTNSSSLFYLDNTSINLSAGSSLFSVTPTFSSWSGTLSLSSANGGNVFLTDNSGLNLSSGSNFFTVTPTLSHWGGTLSVTGSLTATGSVFLTNSSCNFALNSSDIILTSSSSSITLNSLGMTNSGALNSGGKITVTSAAGIEITNGGGLLSSGPVSASSFSGNGGSITLLNASNISTGTLGDGRLSSNIPKLNQFNNFTAPIFVAATPGQDAITGIASGMVPGPPSNLAGKFYGNVNITGNLTKGSGTFKIDHPLDPLNKYLYHSFVESPDMMNIYTGTISLNEEGKAIVNLPEWFESLNKDFHYQLTCVGGYAQVFISKEIEENKFEIAGGKENMKVSWQVTGTRKDAYAEKYRVQVEEEKPVGEKGTYLHPDAFVNE